jgi:hypothetical protein
MKVAKAKRNQLVEEATCGRVAASKMLAAVLEK